MKSSFFLRLWISCALFAALAPSAATQAPGGAVAPVARTETPAEKLTLPGLPNAGKISEFLYRGAQPKPEGYAELKRLGVTTVVNLRKGSDDTERERRQVEALGMRYVGIPTNGRHGPSHEQVAEFLHLLQASPRERVFVHCRLGADRTGVMIAAFRIAQQQWTPQQALDEMLAFHFHKFWHPGMARYVKQFPSRFASEPAFAGLRLSMQTSPSSRAPN